MCKCREKFKYNETFDGTCNCQPEPKFKVGDRVYSPSFGWGIVLCWTPNNRYVRIDDGTRREAFFGFEDGRIWSGGEVMLFHDKPTIIPAKTWNSTRKYCCVTLEYLFCSLSF